MHECASIRLLADAVHVNYELATGKLHFIALVHSTSFFRQFHCSSWGSCLCLVICLHKAEASETTEKHRYFPSFSVVSGMCFRFGFTET